MTKVRAKETAQKSQSHNDSFREHLNFEKLISDLSAKFVNIGPDHVEGEIEVALKQVLDFFQVDRCGLLKTSRDRKSWQVALAVYANNIPPVPERTDLPLSLFPWAASRILDQHEVVCFKNTDELPPQADIDRESYKAWRIKSSMTIPILTGGSVDYVLSIDAVSENRAWPEIFIPRLRLLGEIFVNALERKRADHFLRESEARLSLATDAAGVIPWTLDVDSGRIWVTEKGKKFFGFALESELDLDGFLNIVHPEDRENLRRAVEVTMKSGKDNRAEYRVVLSDGSVRWVVSRGRTYPATSKEPARLMGVSLDVTQRRKAEEARAESMERYRAIVEAYDGYIYVCSQDFRIEFMNDRLIGRTGRDAVGESCFKVLHDRDSVCPWCVNEQIFRGETVQWEIQSPKDQRWYYVVNTPIRHADGSVSKQSMILDITNRKKAEEERSKAYEEIKKLKERLEQENVYLREEISEISGDKSILGQSDAMKYVFFRIRQVASTDSTVLITGETGTGKGLVARAIHEAGKRRNRPLVVVNCAALPETLIDSELFGREKGAFTGANESRPGRFEIADTGTIFLDEIDELPLELQAKLLRVVESGEFERLGSSRTTNVDVRIIASTNRDLKKEVREGRFREDLFYRLNVFPITLPPLRQRADDIPMLVSHFVARHNRKMRRDFKEVPQKVMKALEEFSWPGNVRELENVIERAVISTPGHVLELAEPLSAAHNAPASNSKKGLADVERHHILGILNENAWKIEGKSGAARILGLRPSTLRSRMKKLDIKRPTHL